MTDDLSHLYWDSCIFIRFLTGTPSEYVNDIADFILESRPGNPRNQKRTIYFSTLTFTEILQEHFVGQGFGSIRDFFDDLGAAFVPVSPDPNIMIMAGALRSVKTVNPKGPKEKSRVLGTPDSIHLATCLYLQSTLGIDDLVFHSLDNGRGASWEGKCVPILSFERWYPPETRTTLIDQVCALKRRKPEHPQPRLRGT